MPIDPHMLNELSASLSGRLYTPADAAWREVSKSWNPALPQHPIAVVEPASADDVGKVVAFGRAHAVPVAAQASGHAATAALDGTILVRTAGLTELSVDADAKTARVGAGVRWRDVLAKLEGTKLGALAGTHPDINVVAFLLGGGLSWFSRGFGRSSAHLLSVQLVDGAGRIREVDDTSDPHLMRALRGGGGEFGIVTAATIELVELPELSGGRLEFPGVFAESLARMFVSLIEVAPRESAWSIGFHRDENAEELVPGEVPTVQIDVVHRGPESDLVLALDALSTAGSATRTTVADRGIATLVDVAEEPSEPNPIRRFSVLVDAIDVDLITSLARVAADHLGLLSVELRQLGGALAEEPRRPAIAGPIAAGGLITATARAHDAQAVEAAGAAFAALKDAIAGRIVRGLPVTFLANDQGLGEAYSEGDLEFLRAVRTEVNREGTIRGNRHIV